MSLGFLQLIGSWTDWEDDFIALFCRIHWLRCHIFRREGNNDLAINSLELVNLFILFVTIIHFEHFR